MIKLKVSDEKHRLGKHFLGYNIHISHNTMLLKIKQMPIPYILQHIKKEKTEKKNRITKNFQWITDNRQESR